jgi:hypothetical protein
MILSDIPILGVAVFPNPLLSKVTIKMMPLVDCIEYFFSGNDNPAFHLLEFKPSQYLTGFQVSWGKNFLKVILMNIFLAQFVLLMKVK